MTGAKGSSATVGLGPATPFGDSARVVLSRRLKSVKESLLRLRDAARAGVIDPDEVHQVRVGVRRASAAIRVFGPCVKDERALSRLRRRLRRLRRSIGAARACDVSLALLAHDRKGSEGETRQEIERLEALLRKQRKRSIAVLRRSLDRYTKRRLNRWRRRLVRGGGIRTSGIGAGTLETTAGPALSGLLRSVRTLGAGDLSSAESLHELRLAVKRLRYSIEVFGPCFDSESLDAAATLLAEMQDRLGSANDVTDIVALLDRRLTRQGSSPPLAALREDYLHRFEVARSEFVSWWRTAGEVALVDAVSSLVGEQVECGMGEGTASGNDPGRLSQGPFPSITPGVNGSRM